MRSWGWIVALRACARATSVIAQTAEETAGQFGARESALGASLAPSGKKMAFVGPGGKGTEMG